MSERAILRISDVLDAIGQIEKLVEGTDFQRFQHDRAKRAAYERFVEILSEASRHVPDALKTAHPEVSWIDVANIGNHLRHAYNRTDPEILWNLHEKGHLILLKAACENFMKKVKA